MSEGVFKLCLIYYKKPLKENSGATLRKNMTMLFFRSPS
jgi:hypothetical protein